MTFPRGVLQNEAVAFLATLTEEGFSKREAYRFLPEAMSLALESMRDRVAELESESLDDEHNVSLLIEGVDLDELGERTRVPPARARRGLEALLPALLRAIQEQWG